MSNEYSYQIPNDGDQNYTESNQEPENRRPKKKGRKVVAVVCAGMVFGLVASVTFQASNYMVERQKVLLLQIFLRLWKMQCLPLFPSRILVFSKYRAFSRERRNMRARAADRELLSERMIQNFLL